MRLLLLVLVLSGSVFSAEYRVAPDGSDVAAGTASNPWKTLQYALNQAVAGDVVRARGGVYSERLVFPRSGISLTAFGEERPVLDGSSLHVASGWDPLLDLNGQSNLLVDGFELRNLRSDLKNHVPMGLLVRGGSKNIQLSNLSIHDIETNYEGRRGGDAHGLAVYGDCAASSVSNLLIDAVEIYDCRLGSSESMVINGNVEQFTVRNCRIHDNNNIGIDFIGHEGACSDAAFDQARDGLCVGNTVSNIVTLGNPAYAGDRSANGIYVDGGTRIIIERNIVHDCDIGIEIGSEHRGKSTSHITVRSNWIYRNYTGGIFIGGYDATRGKADHCAIVGNTLWKNDTGMEYNGEIYLQMYIENCRVENNLIVPLPNEGGDAVFIGGIGTVNSTPVNTLFNHNLYWSEVPGPDHHLWTWGGREFYAFSDWQALGQDAQAVYALNPLLVDPQSGNLHLSATSPAIGAGTRRGNAGSVDLDGQKRGNDVDIGADEYVPDAQGETSAVWLDRCKIGAGRSCETEQSDLDGDGQTARQEYFFGTSPYSFVKVTSCISDNIWLRAENGSPVHFLIFGSNNCAAEAWQTVAVCLRTGTNRRADPLPPAGSLLFNKLTVFFGVS